MTDTDPSELAARSGRRAAGEDPAKRDQILDGAGTVFMEKGFDGASMNDICRAAGVSKGTLYVYFEDKLDLFQSLISRKRERFYRGLEEELNTDAPLRHRLYLFTRRMAEMLCSDEVIRAQRIIIGSAEKMPEMAGRFYDAGASQTHRSLAAFLERECAAGRLKIDDCLLAGSQLVELSTAGLWRKRLFAKVREKPTPEEIERTVTSAVDLFLARYGV